MRVGVIGAGAVGGALAAVLVRAGHEVQVTARGEHLEAIHTNGLHLSGVWGDYTAYLSAVEVLDRGAELIIVATKAQDSSAALANNAAYLVGTPILVIQNGLDALTRAQRIAPGSDVVGGLATFASSYLSPGTITVTAPGHLYLGGGGGDHDVPARYAARVLGEVLPVTVLDNFVGAQWTKLIINHINALPAITGMSAQEVAANPTLLRIMTASMRETIGVASAHKIRFETLQGLSARKVRMLPHLPVSMGERLPRALISAMGTVPNPGSTLQSIRRGQPTEIDYLNGAVVRAAAQNGGSAPINAALVALVHEVERTGTFLSAEDVARRVPLTVR